jgi:Mg2+ and Co2+ transporter CorA
MTQNLFTLYRSIQDEQQNRVLLLLTLVTSIFVPAQFLTGLWGMNFTNVRPSLILSILLPFGLCHHAGSSLHNLPRTH